MLSGVTCARKRASELKQIQNQHWAAILANYIYIYIKMLEHVGRKPQTCCFHLCLFSDTFIIGIALKSCKALCQWRARSKPLRRQVWLMLSGAKSTYTARDKGISTSRQVWKIAMFNTMEDIIPSKIYKTCGFLAFLALMFCSSLKESNRTTFAIFAFLHIPFHGTKT